MVHIQTVACTTFFCTVSRACEAAVGDGSGDAACLNVVSAVALAPILNAKPLESFAGICAHLDCHCVIVESSPFESTAIAGFCVASVEGESCRGARLG